jgi:hypothetical protein
VHTIFCSQRLKENDLDHPILAWIEALRKALRVLSGFITFVIVEDALARGMRFSELESTATSARANQSRLVVHSFIHLWHRTLKTLVQLTQAFVLSCSS